MINSASVSLSQAIGRPASMPVSVLAVCAGALFACRTIFALVAARWLNASSELGVLFGFAASGVLTLVGIFAAMGKKRDSATWNLGIRTVQWVMVYLAFAGCSLLWTSSNSPAASALYWLILVSDVSIVVLVVRSCGAVQGIHSLMKGFIAATCVLAAIAWIMPVEADLRLGDLEYFNTNQIANLCALAMLMCALLAARKDGRWRVASLFLGITLFRTLSKSTLIAFAACQAYRLIRDREMSSRRKWLIVFAVIVLILGFCGLLNAYVGLYTTTGNQAQTLTGRTGIWLWTIGTAIEKPLFGNGFDAMWKVAPPFGPDLFEARHAENELLQQFFAYGVCGVAMLVGIYGSLLRMFRRLPRGGERTVLVAIIIFIVIRGLAEAEPFDLLLPLWLVMGLSSVTQERLNEIQCTSVPGLVSSEASAFPAI